VTKFKVRDEVYGCLKYPNTGGDSYSRSRPCTQLIILGSVAEYAVTHQDTIASKPSTLTHVEAASLTIVALTAIQAFDRAVALKGSLEGKTVFIPAALSGTGSIGLQLAKNVYGATKVITTASAPKIPKIPDLLGPNLVDQIVDYKSQDPLTEIPHRTVDLVFDTLGAPFSFLPLVKPKTGVVISIAAIPSGAAIATLFPQWPFYARYLVELGYQFYKWRVGRWSVAYDGIIMDIASEDLDRLRTWVDEGKVRPVVGKTVRLDDLEAVREGCNEVYKGHGVGKTVILI
jgi:NADPH:quinone reductase-like Zn-dependent oxidoreductase